MLFLSRGRFEAAQPNTYLCTAHATRRASAGHDPVYSRYYQGDDRMWCGVRELCGKPGSVDAERRYVLYQSARLKVPTFDFDLSLQVNQPRLVWLLAREREDTNFGRPEIRRGDATRRFKSRSNRSRADRQPSGRAVLDGTGNRRDEGAKGSICSREASVCSAQTRHGTYAVMGGFGRQVELLMRATALGVTVVARQRASSLMLVRWV